MLEVEGEHGGNRTRRDVVRTAEGRKEVVERILVGQINNRYLTADFVLVAAKQVVMSEGEIEEIPGRDALRIVIVVLGIGRGHFYQR
jgi:hypothetical protein